MKKSALLVAVLAFAGGIFAAQYFLASSPAPLAHDPQGTTVPVGNGQFGGDFSLQQAGNTFKLSDYQGKVVLLYFGYTACPDICPTSLAIIGAALKLLSPEELAQIQPVFISVDPERDQGERLMTYARHFNPGFVGVTGTPAQIQQAAKQYGVYYAKVESNSAMGYLIDHTSQTYLVSKDGASVTVLPHGSTPAEVAANIRQAL